MYFGMKEYCDSIKWTHQFPLIRQDDAFERMALRTSRYGDFHFVCISRLAHSVQCCWNMLAAVYRDQTSLAFKAF